MRKQAILLLIPVLILAVALPGYAADFSRLAVDYLAEKYGVAEDNIFVSEGHTITLEYLQESFWCAKYEISAAGRPAGNTPDQGTAGPPPGQIDPVPPVVMPLPEPELPTSDLPAPHSGQDPDAPVSSGPLYDDNRAYPAESDAGAIYIREATGEILDSAAMETYFLRERELAAAAWAELQKEAGKVEVNFYKLLREAAADTKFKVLIIPVFLETPELTQRFNKLLAAYPEFSRGISSLSEMFGNTASYPFGMTVEADVAVDLPAAAETAGDAPLVYESGKGAGSAPAYSGSPGEPAHILPAPADRGDYEAFHRELEAIRLDGLAASARIITDKLAAMDISYTSDYGVISAELAKSQIDDLAALDAVQLIYADQAFAREPGRALNGEAAYDTAAAAPEAMPAGDDNELSPYLLLFAVPLVCAVFLLRRRFFAR